MSPLIEFALGHIPLLFFSAAAVYVVYMIKQRRDHLSNAQELLTKAISTSNHEPLSLHPDIDPHLCTGCGACTTACPEGDILKLVNHKAVLVSPSNCVGHGECERACPMGAIKLVFGTKTKGAEIPRLTPNYETNIPGMYIAGELGGMGLIRNAVRQGALAAEHALTHLTATQAQYDIVIIGAGAAGMAAGLAAIARKKKYLLIEQDKFGGTIANFPRQKIVMSHPIELPLVGRRVFDSNVISKEGILGYWEDVRKRTGLKVKEKTKFETVERKENLFVIKTNQGEFTASKVILAMGVRGSARKLGVEGEGLSKVTYNLIEPDQYQHKHVLVVGGGNAAAEAALMLSHERLKNKVLLFVRTETMDRCNDENRRKLEALEKQGRLKIWFNTHVVKIDPEFVKFNKAGTVQKVKNDYVFIFAGAEMPRQFLMSLGVQIDKKFGEGLVS